MKIDEFKRKASKYVEVQEDENGIFLCSKDDPLSDVLLSLDPSKPTLELEYNDSPLEDISLDTLIKVLSVVKELRDTPTEERFPEKKYTVQVFNNETGYLNVADSGEFFTGNPFQYKGFKTHFTQREINMLKQRDDLAIDWDKAKIEEVSEDE